MQFTSPIATAFVGVTVTVATILAWLDPNDAFKKTLLFKQHTFQIETDASGAVRNLTLNVLRNNESLVVIRQKTDGWITAAEVADLDNNNSPEVYIYACSYGSGAFGKVYAFQFYPNNFEPIYMAPMTPSQTAGYMGHDSFKIENNKLVRRFPIYRPGDSNAQPTGGTRKMEYSLKTVNKKLFLSVSKVE